MQLHSLEKVTCESDVDTTATVLASGLIPIQLEHYYFEFKLVELGADSEVIIGCQIHGHELDQEWIHSNFIFIFSSDFLSNFS